MTVAPGAMVAAWIRGHWAIEDRLHYVREHATSPSPGTYSWQRRKWVTARSTLRVPSLTLMSHRWSAVISRTAVRTRRRGGGSGDAGALSGMVEMTVWFGPP